MERKFLEGLGLEKEVIDQILDQNSAEIGKHKKAVEAAETERDGLKTQLDEANKAIKGFEGLDVEGIKAKAEEWETKYNTDTQALKDQLAAKEYEYSVNGAVTGLKFTSESARKAFVADLTAKKLPVQDGMLLGMEDFVKAYQETDPAAFAPEGAPIQIVKGSGKTPLAEVTPEAYKKMGYVERLQLKTENPELYQQLAGR